MTKSQRDDIFEGLFHRNYQRLFLYATYLMRSNEMAKDIVSEAFSRAWERYAEIDANKLEAFLMVAVRNRCLDLLRQKKTAYEYKEAQLLAEEIAEDGDTEYDERLDKVLDLINNMPAQTQFVIRQCYLEEKSYKDVAEIMNISTSGVKKHIMKGLNIIREYFSVNYKKGSDQN